MIAARVGSLIAEPEVEKRLQTFPIQASPRNAEREAGVWDQFQQPSDSAMPHIMERVVYLLLNIGGADIRKLPGPFRRSLELSPSRKDTAAPDTYEK